MEYPSFKVNLRAEIKERIDYQYKAPIASAMGALL
jgi:hypothetical protein